MSTLVKYHYNSYRRANNLKLANTYIFYLQLKSICKNGVFKKGEVIKEVTSQLNYSPGQVSNLFKKLIEAKFLIEYKTKEDKIYQYILISQRKANKILGFKDHYKDRPTPKFKFSYLDLKDINNKQDIKGQIVTHELKNNSLKQKFRKEEKLIRQINYHQDTLEKVKRNTREKKVAKLKHLNELLKESRDETLSGQDNTSDQFKNKTIQIKISCKRTATLMGNKSAITGLNLQKFALNQKFITIKKETVIKAEGVTKKEFESDFLKYSRCFWSFGKVYERKCNILTLEPLFLNKNYNIVKTVQLNVKHTQMQ